MRGTRTTRRHLSTLIALLASVYALPAVAQKPPPPPELRGAGPMLQPGDDKTIRVDVDLVQVNVTVTDPYGRLVTGLEREHFRVEEDKTRQEISHFSSEDVPISIGVILDLSGSMSNKFDKARQAALRFMRTANPLDEFLLVSFNERAQLVSHFTSDVETVQSRMMFITPPKGRTALYDAVYLALAQMRDARHTRKAILIISDGGDNHSRYNERDVRNFVREADVQLYAIGIYDPWGYRGTPEERWGPTLLSEMTEMTGGRSFSVENLNDLPDIASKISLELRNQYVIGYRPSNHEKDGKWRKIRVKVKPPRGLPPLQVYSRTGYYAPKQ